MGATIDTFVPVVTVDTLDTTDTTPALSGTIDDDMVARTNTVTISVNVNGSDYPATNNMDGTWSLADDTISPALVDGDHEVTATATDALGNVGTDGTTNELFIDTAAPVISVDFQTTSNTTPVVTGAVTDASTTTVSVEVSGNTYVATVTGSTWSATISTPLSGDQSYDVIATATDSLGNEATDVTDGELTIDVTDPVVTVDTLSTNNTMPTLSGTVVDTTDTTVSVDVNGESYGAIVTAGTWTANVTTALAEGTYEVTATPSSSMSPLAKS